MYTYRFQLNYENNLIRTKSHPFCTIERLNQSYIFTGLLFYFPVSLFSLLASTLLLRILKDRKKV